MTVEWLWIKLVTSIHYVTTLHIIKKVLLCM